MTGAAVGRTVSLTIGRGVTTPARTNLEAVRFSATPVQSAQTAERQNAITRGKIGELNSGDPNSRPTTA